MKSTQSTPETEARGMDLARPLPQWEPLCSKTAIEINSKTYQNPEFNTKAGPASTPKLTEKASGPNHTFTQRDQPPEPQSEPNQIQNQDMQIYHSKPPLFFVNFICTI